MIRFLFTSGAFGFVGANNASISGAMGGCQATPLRNVVNLLKDPVTVLKGIGEETAKNLALMDIHYVTC